MVGCDSLEVVTLVRIQVPQYLIINTYSYMVDVDRRAFPNLIPRHPGGRGHLGEALEGGCDADVRNADFYLLETN